MSTTLRDHIDRRAKTTAEFPQLNSRPEQSVENQTYKLTCDFISRPEHSPKRIYKRIKKGTLQAQREALLILQAEFYIDPEGFPELLRGVLALLELAMDNQSRCGQRQTARKAWRPTFERAVLQATGEDLTFFLPEVESQRATQQTSSVS